MASRPTGFGYSAEIKRKIKQSYDPELEQQARIWIEDILGEELKPGSDRNTPLGMDEFHKVLKDGQVLCRLINTLKPGALKKINTNTTIKFKQVENIGNFLEACCDYGVSRNDLFNSPALYENENMTAVVNMLHSLGRAAQKNGFHGPKLGVRESEHNPRNFSEEKLREGHTVIGLQMGCTKGANQQGLNFGKTRSITD